MFYRIILLLTTAVILAFQSCTESAKVQEKITYATHIAPVFKRTCVRCHVAGEAAPFELLTYEDVALRGKLIEYVTTNRIMPPWPADPTYSHFANETVLTSEEIEMIKRWVDEGMDPGDLTRVDQTGNPHEIKYQSGKPDLVLHVPRISIKGNNTDLFTAVKVPYEIPNDTFVRAIEFVCSNKKLVHHMNGHLILFDAQKKKNVNEGKSWVDQDQSQSQRIHKELGLLHDDGSYPVMTPSVSNYLPGALFSFYPKEIGGYKMTKKGALYLNDLHFGPSPVDAIDSSYFKIYFSDAPPKRPVSEFQIGTLGIAPVEPQLIVPPNTKKSFRTKATMPADISLVSIVPHMHLIGKSFFAYAIKPDGDTIPLIRIRDWDFRWQYFYQFKTLLKIPKGTTIYAEGEYDNTASNPNNPFSPPREIRERNGSMKTTDEMFQLIVTYVPYQAGDEEISLE